jgi:glucose-1-phosphate adenylyltransferase
VHIHAVSVMGYDHEVDKKQYHVTESVMVVIVGTITPLQLSTIRV